MCTHSVYPTKVFQRRNTWAHHVVKQKMEKMGIKNHYSRLGRGPSSRSIALRDPLGIFVYLDLYREALGVCVSVV